ncbi:alkaline phosphatase family protein [Brevundimonas sp.]|uniref:alkaline phosphatase family protein n=1 Tax=Brevundimonas sp. TaxID=1871086 RepID=UPI0025C2C645|nr:alkaline phosphatase family protein [Brevundimonas sp.]
MNRVRTALAAVSLLALGACSTVQGWWPADAAAPSEPAPVAAPVAESTARPTLVVTIVIDQFSANLFNQYRDDFTGGLAVLAQQGRVHANGFQQHGLTETCPGHSTVLTGMNPARTGIPANDWVDPATGKEVYCLAAPANHLAHGDDTSDNGPVGPGQLEVTTLADWLKTASPQSRVYAVSGKDRGAINLNGHLGDGAFWYTDGFGFTTYVEPGQTPTARLAPVAALNARIAERLRVTPAAWTYTHDVCRRLTGDWRINGRTFHSDLPPQNFALDTSPMLDELTLEAATELLETKQLGRRGVVDMLGVSLSGTDRIGHSFGTQGPEMCEQMYRLDAALGRFLQRLPQGSIVVLTADHGGSDFVERLAVRGYPHAHRADPQRLANINGALKARFGLDYDPLSSGGSGLMVGDKDHKGLPEPLRTRIIEAALPLLRANADVAFAESRDVLLAEPLPPATLTPDLMTVRQRMRLSAVAERSPDLIIALAENVVSGGRVGGTIANHGTPWDYDRRVPIIFWWPGAQGQERFLPIRTIDIAPTLAPIVGVQTPAGLDGRCIDLQAPGGATCPLR